MVMPLMRVLLISANQLADPYPVYPLGVDHVAGAVAAGGHQVQLLDLRERDVERAVTAAMGQFAPGVVGVSMRNVDNCDQTKSEGYVGLYHRVVRAVRGATDAPLVLGGAAFSIFPGQFMAALGADYGVLGEGERAVALLDALERGDDPAGLPGVVTPGGGEMPAPWSGPIRRGFPANEALVGRYLQFGGMLNLQTKRGCPYNCVYCTYPRIEGHRIRPFPPDEVARVARRLQDGGARFLFFTDSAFNADTEHNLELAAAMREHGVSVPWGGFFAPRRPPDGYYERLAEAGLSHVEFGTEALSPTMLRSYRKPFDVDDVRAAHAAAVGAGVQVAHFFLLGGPGETLRTIDETLDNAEGLVGTVLFFYCGVRIYPHTPLMDIALAEGQIGAADDLLEPVFYRPPALEGVDVDRHVLARGRKRMNWIVGGMGGKLVRIVSAMHARGHVGPLWEILVR